MTTMKEKKILDLAQPPLMQQAKELAFAAHHRGRNGRHARPHVALVLQ